MQYINFLRKLKYIFSLIFCYWCFLFNNPVIAQEIGTFTDSRDNNTYSWVKIKGQIWMAENLSFLPEVDHPSCGTLQAGMDESFYYVYDYTGESANEAKSTVYYKKYGVLYNYKAALEACPSGWHLPSDEEYMILEKNLGMSEKELKEHYYRMGGEIGEKLKSKNGWNDNGGGINFAGFNAIPSGLRNSGNPTNPDDNWRFSNEGNEAYFWTSTFVTKDHGGIAYRRQLSAGSKGIVRFPINIENGYSVRCVKD